MNLQKALDALEQSQSEQQFKDAVIAVKVHYDNIANNIKRGREEKAQTFAETNDWGYQRGEGEIPFVLDERVRAKAQLPTGEATPESGKTVVERRTTADGRNLVKYSDGTIGEE